LAGLVVVPDRGGQREESLGDSDTDAFHGAAVVWFESKLIFKGVEDRFDELADGLRSCSPGRAARLLR
jgi:hypothetical protein